MKKLNLILCCLAFLSCYAQDKVILKDLSKIEGQVLSLGTNSVLIEVNGEPKGYSASEVLTVVLSNGTIKTYNEYNSKAGDADESTASSSIEAPSPQGKSNAREYDIIILKDATRIEAFIMEVSDSEIRYKKANSQSGPIFVQNMDKVSAIMYTTGEVSVNNQSSSKNSTDENKSGLYHSGKGTKFQFNWETGCVFNGQEAGPTMDFTLGGRFTDWLFAGYNFGVHTLMKNPKSDHWYVGIVPISLNMKFYLPVTAKFFPHIDATIGFHTGWFGYYEWNYYYNTMYYHKGRELGLFARTGIGFEIKSFKFGLGYEFMSNGHHGYFNIGCTVPYRSKK